MKRHCRNVLIILSALAATVCFATAALGEGYALRGWQFQHNDEQRIMKLLDMAPQYGINHIQLSHSIVMNIDEITADETKRGLIDRVSKRADELGIETFVWAHEFNTDELTACFDPSKKQGAEFWKKRREVYRAALEAVPAVDGVVLMFGSSSPEPWSLMCTCCGAMSNADRVRIIIEQVGAEVNSAGKTLYVRTFIHTPGELELVGDAIRAASGVEFTVMSKDVPQDWQPYYPDNPLIGNVGGRPQVIEVDLAGEYWGQSGIPFQVVDYLKRRVRYWRTKENVVGAVARIERGSRDVFDNPNEVNAFAFSEYMKDPGADPDEIWKKWAEAAFGFTPDSDVSNSLISALRRTYDAGRKMYYTLGFWTLEKGSDVPDTGRYPKMLDRRSTALYDPDFKPVFEELKNPSPQTLENIWQENFEAQILADRSRQELHRIQRAMGGRYEQYKSLFERLNLCAKVWTHVEDAVWRFMYWKNTGDGEAARIIEWDLRSLEDLAARIEEVLGADSWPGSPERIRKFVKDTETEFPRIENIDDRVEFPGMIEIRAEQVGADSAVITWISTSKGSSRVEYGRKVPVYEWSTESGGEPADWHSVSIGGLAPDTEYIFRTVTILEDGTRLVSGDYSFRTEPAEK